MNKQSQQQKRANLVVRELKKLFPNAKTILHFSNDIELLIAVMLSAQTTDKQVNVVTANLFQKYKTLDDYIAANPQEFEKDISSVNFFRNKAKYILKTTKLLKEKHDGLLPKTLSELIELPGVGRKTALVVLGNAYNIVEGIAVDTHVHRLSRQFGLTEHIHPEKIEKDLQKLIPREEWFHITNRMIDYGRSYSPAKKGVHRDPITLKLAKLG